MTCAETGNYCIFLALMSCPNFFYRFFSKYKVMRRIGGKCGSRSQVELHKTMNMRLPKGLAVDANVVLVHRSSFITQ